MVGEQETKTKSELDVERGDREISQQQQAGAGVDQSAHGGTHEKVLAAFGKVRVFDGCERTQLGVELMEQKQA